MEGELGDDEFHDTFPLDGAEPEFADAMHTIKEMEPERMSEDQLANAAQVDPGCPRAM